MRPAPSSRSSTKKPALRYKCPRGKCSLLRLYRTPRGIEWASGERSGRLDDLNDGWTHSFSCRHNAGSLTFERITADLAAHRRVVVLAPEDLGAFFDMG